MKPKKFSDGTLRWYINGRLHREDGPAIISSNTGKEYWYFDGRYIGSEIKAWMEESGVSQHHSEWTDADKVLFKIRFC